MLLTIHQPPASAYAALDDVLILKQGNLVCVCLHGASWLTTYTVLTNLTDVLYRMHCCVAVRVYTCGACMAGIMARLAVFPRTSGTWDCGWMCETVLLIRLWSASPASLFHASSRRLKTCPLVPCRRRCLRLAMARPSVWSCVYCVDVHFGCSGGSRRLPWFLLLGTCLSACSEVLSGCGLGVYSRATEVHVELVPPLFVLGRCFCVWCPCGPNLRVRSVGHVWAVVVV